MLPPRKVVRHFLLFGTVFGSAFGVIGCRPSDEPSSVFLETGAGPGQVVYPRVIEYSASDDTLFVVDRMARIQHLTKAGKCLAAWRMPEFEAGKPVGASLGPDGNLYVADTHYHRVIVYTPTGAEVRRFGSRGTGTGEFIYPTDIAFDAAGLCYVSEYGDNDRIQVFDATGRVVRTIGSAGSAAGQFIRPQSIAIRDGLLYVADSCNHRVQVLTLEGVVVRVFGGSGDGPGEFRFPYGLTFNPAGNLVITEFGNNRVQVIDAATGKNLRTLGHAGHEPGEFAYPWAAACDGRGDLFVLDSGNNRIQSFSP